MLISIIAIDYDEVVQPPSLYTTEAAQAAWEQWAEAEADRLPDEGPFWDER